MRGISHTITTAQALVSQPSLLTVFFCWMVPSHVPRLLTVALVKWPTFVALASTHGTAYRVGFFLVQLALLSIVIVLISSRYRTALWSPQPAFAGRQVLLSLLVLLPLLAYHFWDSVSAIHAVAQIARMGPEGAALMKSVFFNVWGNLPYGASMSGIMCYSLLMFLGPVGEEMIFSGLLINRIGRWFGFVGGVLGAAACFCLVHAIPFGWDIHLAGLFLAGLTYGTLRVVTGSLWTAILGHWLINAMICVPKWMVAVYHFGAPSP